MNLNMAIREIREAYGESQQAFATRLGISIRGLANYEKERNPPLGILLALSKLARNPAIPTKARQAVHDAARDEIRRHLGPEYEVVDAIFSFERA